MVEDLVILQSGNSVNGMVLILGGAALQRCGGFIVVNAALAAEVSGGDAKAS